MSMGLYRTQDTEEDFAYVRNYRNMIQGELAEWIPCELQVHRTSAFLVLSEESRLGRCFPEENTISDIVLLCNHLIWEEIKAGNIPVPADERIRISRVQFMEILEHCKARYGKGFIKTYREMLTGEFCREIFAYMKSMELIEEKRDTVWIRTAVGKVFGAYPEDFDKDRGEEEK